MSGLLEESYAANASVAYSIRRLSETYNGYCLRVREATGGTEQDIGFDKNGILDYAAIEAHCSGASGFVTKWYNQGSGGATYDVANTTQAEQPRICNSGTADVAPVFDGSNDNLFVDASPVTAAPFSIFAWAETTTTASDGVIIGLGDKDVSNQHDWVLFYNGPDPDMGWLVRDTTLLIVDTVNQPVLTDTIQSSAAVEAGSTDHRVFLNAANKNTDAGSRAPVGADRISLGRTGDTTPASPLDGKIYEVIIFTDTKSDADVSSLHLFGDPRGNGAAFEFHIGVPHDMTAQNVYAILRNSSQQVWNGSSFEDYNTDSYNIYTIDASEQGSASQFYAIKIPSSLSEGVYSITFYEETGTAGPSEMDPAIDHVENFYWTGTEQLSLHLIDNKIPTALVAGNMASDMGGVSAGTSSIPAIERVFGGLTFGSVDGGTLQPGTTVFETDLTEASDDHFNNKILRWGTGTSNAGLAFKISDSEGTTTNPNNKVKLTMATEMPNIPPTNDVFVIIGVGS